MGTTILFILILVIGNGMEKVEHIVEIVLFSCQLEVQICQRITNMYRTCIMIFKTNAFYLYVKVDTGNKYLLQNVVVFNFTSILCIFISKQSLTIVQDSDLIYRKLTKIRCDQVCYMCQPFLYLVKLVYYLNSIHCFPPTVDNVDM